MNHENEICQLLAAPPVKRPKKAQPKQTSKLDAGEIESLVARYEAGESTRQLSADSTSHRHTIARALKEAGVDMRDKQRQLTDKQVAKAAELYQQGQTLAQLADRFNVAQTTVRREFILAGHQLRPRGGRR